MGREAAWLRATRWAVLVVGLLIVVLAVTGTLLIWRYRPTTTQAFANVPSLGDQHPLVSLRNAHRWTARLLFPAGAFLGVASIGLFVVRRRFVAISLPIIGGLLAFVASITGLLIAWDQLALYSVTVGSDMRGYLPILRGTSVKYVLLDNTEVSRDTFVGWFWVHVLVVPLAIVAVLVVIAFLTRRRSEQPLGREVGAGAQGAELLPDD